MERGRLNARFERGSAAKLTLVSAPAGFGKTTAISAWLAGRSGEAQAVAWLSLDQLDNDVAVFWTHLIAALHQAANGAIEPILLPEPVHSDEMLASIVNALAAFAGSFDIVLDDYHVIEQVEITAGVSFLIERLPPHVHLVISTRADPDLPLGRLRACGELVEIRASDLRFATDEVGSYLNGSMGLRLNATDVTVLAERTEGWIAALQLAALSIEGRADASRFIAGFAGSDRYIVDYLVEEVLQQASEEVRDFMFRTCFLERLSGPLCDAVTGSEGSKAMLHVLDRQNLFLVPLDDYRHWYRYHHLFADVLLAHLPDPIRSQLPLLHRRASDWYWAQDEPVAAVRHAFAAKDLARAAELIERTVPQMQKYRGEATLRGWSRLLPRDLVRQRPVLGIGLVGSLVSYGEFDDIEDRLSDVERGLRMSDAVVYDTTQLPRLPGAIALYRAALAQVRGDMPGLIAQAQRVLDVAPPDDHIARAAGSSMLGIALWSAGQLEPARRAWTEGRTGLLRAGHIADVLGVSLAIADITRAQGHLAEAVRTCTEALRIADEQRGIPLKGTADMHAALADLYRERNETEAARQHLQLSQEQSEQGLPQHPYRWRVAAALLRRDDGDLDGAVALLDEAERLYVSDFFPNVRPIAAMRARIWITQGRLDAVVRWQRDQSLAVDDDLSYLREYEQVTLARLLMAQGSPQVAGFLDRLLDAATLGARTASSIEILFLQAMAPDGNDAAFTVLERALVLAETEGYVRMFVEGGERAASLLKAALRRGITPAYTRKLLAAFGSSERHASAHPDLIEALSDRERDVLRLLRGDLGGPDIARELMISLNTMRTHTKNIYDKLGVNTRRAAVQRAVDLKLLDRK